jgi:hypothetical protein
MFGKSFGGATAYLKAKGIWRDDDNGGALLADEPVIVHCYTSKQDIEDDEKLISLSGFCYSMGTDTNQGEAGLAIGDEYFELPPVFRLP